MGRKNRLTRSDKSQLKKQSNYELKQYKEQSTKEFNFIPEFNTNAKGTIIFLSALTALSFVVTAANQIEHSNNNSHDSSTDKIGNPKDEKTLQKIKEYSNFISSVVHPGTIVESENVYSINAQIQEDSLIDKKNLEKAYDFSEKIFKNLLSSKKWNINKLINEIIKINGYITGSKGELRDGDMIVKKARDINCPDLINVAAMIDYLQNKPELYKEYVGFVNKVGALQNVMSTSGRSLNYYLKTVLNSPVEDDAKKFLSKYYDYIDLTPKQIKNQLGDLFRNLKTIIVEDPIEAAAYWSIEIVKIHPFADGNGRIARLVENIILKIAGKFPIVHMDGQSYDKAVNDSLYEKNIEIYKKYLLIKISETQAIIDKGLYKGQIIVELASCRENTDQFKKDCSSKIKKLLGTSEHAEELSNVNIQEDVLSINGNCNDIHPDTII